MKKTKKFILVGVLILLIAGGIIYWKTSVHMVFLVQHEMSQPCLVFLEAPSVHFKEALNSFVPDEVEEFTPVKDASLNKEIQNYMLKLHESKEMFEDTTIIPLVCDGEVRYLEITEKPIQLSLYDDQENLLDRLEVGNGNSYGGSRIVSLKYPDRVWFQHFASGATGYWCDYNSSVEIHDDKIMHKSQKIGSCIDALFFFQNISSNPTLKKTKIIWDPFLP